MPTDHHGAPHRGASVWARRSPWLVELPSCPSTNSWALERLDALAHGTVVHTRCQTAGRGQEARRWLSPPGVFTASFVVDLPQPAAGRQLSLAAGLAVSHLVEDLAPRATVGIKWPNDCYCRDRKLAGILCEARIRSGGLRAVVGVGLNVAVRWPADADFSDLGHRPIDLAELGGADLGDDGLIDGLRDYLLEAVGLLRDGRWPVLAAQLRQRDQLLGRALSVTGREPAPPLYGIGAGIDDEGRLILALPDGGTRSIDGGRVRPLPQQPVAPAPDPQHHTKGKG